MTGGHGFRSSAIDLWIHVRSSYWFVPLLLVLAAVLLSYLMVSLDGIVRHDWFSTLSWVFVNQPAGARSVLATIAGSMITVAGVTFSMTLLLVSHASAQIGPRLLTSFMKDRGNQITLGVFLATFVYCLLVLRAVRAGAADDGYAAEFVPHLATAVGIALALGSVLVLIYFIHHAPQTLNISNVVTRLGEEILERIQNLYPAGLAQTDAESSERDPDSVLSGLHRPGHLVRANVDNSYLRVLDIQGLYEAAQQHELIIVARMLPGDFARQQAPLLEVFCSQALPAGLETELGNLFSWGAERTPEQDVRYLIDQLNEIAGKALSPGINNQLTAVACIDQVGAIVGEIGRRTSPKGVWRNEKNQLRLVLKVTDCAGLIDEIFLSMRQYVAGDGLTTTHLLRTIGRCLSSDLSEQVVARLHYHAALIREEATECLPTQAQRRQMEQVYLTAIERGGSE